MSVIGTFALLYFGGFTLNTMTFGGLALGVGMIVDAAIVVLENTHRHLHMGKDRMTAAIEGSEEVWSAISPRRSRIAVFVPLLFPGDGEHHVPQLGRGDVLAGDVALRRRHHRAGALLAGCTPDEEREATHIMARLYRVSEGSRSAWTRATARSSTSRSITALGHRRGGAARRRHLVVLLR